MNVTKSTEATLSPDLPPQSYLNEFSRHQEGFKAHLRGRLPGTQPLPPTHIPPASYWTSAEKDLFFHGLTIYSRLRPDLIAEHIKTKNIFDVCLYLDCLEMGASEAGPVPDSDFNDGGKPRNMTEPAMEVSEEWIQYEETMAARSNALASCPWTLETDARLQCLCPGVRCFGEHDYRPGLSNQTKKTGKEYLAHLDFGSLYAVESIIKDEEKKQDPTPNVVVNPDDVQSTPQPQEVSTVDAELTSQSRQENVAVSNGFAEDVDPHDRATQRRLQKRLYMRRKRAEKKGYEVTLEAVKLRPGRASINKKQTKQDRAKTETKEAPAPPASTPDHDSEDDVSTQNGEPEANVDEEESTTAEEQRRGGLNKAYRVKQVLLDDGIDVEVLTKMNLDLFHLTAVSRVLKLFKSFDGPTESPNTSSISVDTLHLLSTIVVEFVSELIRRAIVSKEQETRLKQSLPIWKYDKYEISGEHLQECIKSMGLDHLNKSNYFGREARHLNRPPPVIDDVVLHSQGTGFTLPDSMMWCSLPAHRELFSSADMISDTEEDLNRLDMEISEEMQVSLDDDTVSKLYEQSLWTIHHLN